MRPSDAGVTDIGALQDTDCLMIDRPGTISVRNRTTIAKLAHRYHIHQCGLVKDELTEELPLITASGGTLTVAEGVVWFYDEIDMDSLSAHTIAETAGIVLTDDAENFICADRDTNTWVVILNEYQNPLLPLDPYVDFLRYVPYVCVFKRTGSNNLHTAPYYLLAHGEVEAHFARVSVTERYAIRSGFDHVDVALGTYAITTLEKAYVYAINTLLELPAITSATRQFKVQKTGTVTSNTIPIVINTHYDDGAGFVPLDGGKWVVNWVFRGVEHEDHLYTLLSKQFDTSAEAIAYNTLGTLPKIIKSHAVKMAKIVVQQGSDILPENIFPKVSDTWD